MDVWLCAQKKLQLKYSQTYSVILTIFRMLEQHCSISATNLIKFACSPIGKKAVCMSEILAEAQQNEENLHQDCSETFYYEKTSAKMPNGFMA